MIFVCGTTQGPSGREPRQMLGEMVGARALAGRHDVATESFHGGLFAHAGGSCVRAEAGPLRGFLLRASGEERTRDQQALDAVLARHADGHALSLVEIGGACLLLVVNGVNGQVSLLNDRFARHPLYYRQANGEFSFASEPGALLAVSGAQRELDAQAIYDYVFFHCIPAPRTIYRGIAKLEPATLLHWDGAAIALDSHWRPQFAGHDDGVDSLAPQLLAALELAVAERARPGCGAFLSGGLDSSTVAGMLKRGSGAARTFTIGFDAEGYDESAYARLASRHFGTEHHEYFVTPADVLESLPRIAAHYGEPFGNSSVLPTYHCARFAREHGVDMMLAGDGGDELFAGNTRYTEQQKFELYFSFPAVLRNLLEGGYRLLPWLNHLPVTGKGARYIQQARMGLPDRLQSYNFLNRLDPASVFESDWLSSIDREAPWHIWRQRYQAPASGDSLQRMLYLDWKFTLADNDLVKVNNMCDLAGVEVCYPMLDDRLVDLAARISSASMLTGGQLRGLYKRACADFLPQEILNKSKHGFGLPFGVWMRTDAGLKNMVREAFAGLRGRGIFRNEFLLDAERRYEREAASYYGELAWILVALEMWFTSHGF